jgi:hypothetical protein
MFEQALPTSKGDEDAFYPTGDEAAWKTAWATSIAWTTIPRMTAALCPLETIRYRADCDAATLASVLDALNRWSDFCKDHQSNRRRHARGAYETGILVSVAARELAGIDMGATERIVLEVQARDLSQAGISLIVAPLFIPQVMSDNTPLLAAHQVFEEGRSLEVRLELPSSRPIWLEGQIVRIRPVQHGFVECGVRFTRRHEADQALPTC